MNVHLFNDTVRGRTATTARRLHHALLTAGVHSHFWHGQPDAEVERDPTFHVLPQAAFRRQGRVQGFVQRVKREIRAWRSRRGLRHRPPALAAFNHGLKGSASCCAAESDGDVLHLHRVAGYLDVVSFFASIPAEVPIVWTVHDMQPFTGGCHHSHGCHEYIEECRGCRRLTRRGGADRANRSFRAKYTALRGKNLHVVTPTRALECQVRRSAILCCARSIRTISRGLDLDAFAPRDSASVHKTFHAPEGAVVFGVDGDEWDANGTLRSPLRALLSRLGDPARYLVLVFGRGTESTL